MVSDRIADLANMVLNLIHDHQYQEVLLTKDEQRPEYKKLKALLISIKKSDPHIQAVYILTRAEKADTWKFVVDAEEEPGQGPRLGNEFKIPGFPEIPTAFSTGIVLDTTDDPSKGEYSLSAYTPFRDQAGNSIAVLRLKMSFESVRIAEKNL